MINDCEARKIDIVIVKTQARFARDSELIEKYLHNKFLEWNVRFKTIIEKIDNTKRETKKTSQLFSLTDEWMLEDTSLNIRKVLRDKREHGQFTGSFPIYGFLKDSENKNHLIIDVVVSGIVKRIFVELANGYGYDKVADGLNEDGILSPLEYKILNGCKLNLPILNESNEFNQIKKAGTYILGTEFLNGERKILKNFTTLSILGTNNYNFSDKFKIKLRRHD